MTTWPWQAAPRNSGARLVGDVSGALKFGAWGDMSALQRFADLTATGNPTPDPFDVKIELSSDSCIFEIDTRECKLRKRLVRCGDVYEVDFGLYALAEHIQAKGCATKMFRNVLVGYDEIGVEAVVAYANFSVGGYTWAKFGARPLEGELHREQLAARLSERAFVDKFASDERKALEKELEHAPIERLMYSVARCASGGGKPLGKLLLLGYAWDAFWDLTDEAHRDLIAEALADEVA